MEKSTICYTPWVPSHYTDLMKMGPYNFELYLNYKAKVINGLGITFEEFFSGEGFNGK